MIKRTLLHVSGAALLVGLFFVSAPINVTTQTLGTPPVRASDEFNRPDGELGPNWTVIDSMPVIVNHHVEEVNASDGNDSIAIYTALTWPADHYSQVTVLAATVHSGCSAIVRAKNDPVIEMYFVYVTGPLGPGARLTLAKFVTHVYTELWTSILTVNAGDRLYLGVSGSTLTVQLNGNTLTTQTDQSITDPGFAGLDITDYDGGGAPGDGQCTDWVGGDLSSITVPTDVTGIAISSDEIDLSWTASTATAGVAGYNVFRNGTQIGTSATTAYADTGLSPSTTYAYAVAAFDAAGNTSPLSAPINIITQPSESTATLLSGPTDVTGAAISSSQFDVSWTAPSGVALGRPLGSGSTRSSQSSRQ